MAAFLRGGSGQIDIVSVEWDAGRGGKAPVILVHGAWHGAWCWEGNFLEQFAAAGHPVRAIDLRGHGNSPAQGQMRWNRIAGYVEDVAGAIAGCARPPVLVGHSMGGFALQHILAKGPPIAGACLLASAPAHGVLRTALHILRTRPRTFLKINAALSLRPVIEDPDAACALLVEPDADAAIKDRLVRHLGDESYMAFLDMLVLRLPRKPAIHPPVLVIGGEDDEVFTPREQHGLARRFDAPCHILPGTPHNIMMSRNGPEAGRIILDWMAGITGE